MGDSKDKLTNCHQDGEGRGRKPTFTVCYVLSTNCTGEFTCNFLIYFSKAYIIRYIL